MGIPVGIDVRDDGIDPRALDRAFDRLRWVDATFSTYRADSEVSRLNAGTLALGDAAPEVRAVLARCETLRARTRGCFDVRARGAWRRSRLRCRRRGARANAHRDHGSRNHGRASCCRGRRRRWHRRARTTRTGDARAGHR